MKLPRTAYRVFEMQTVNDLCVSAGPLNRIVVNCPTVELTYFSDHMWKTGVFSIKTAKNALSGTRFFVRIVLGSGWKAMRRGEILQLIAF